MRLSLAGWWPRFEAKFIPVPESGCWLWLGALGRKGYGRFHYKGRNVIAHRLAYKALRGPIPRGQQLDHKCRTTCCVNPWHLEALTDRAHRARGIEQRPNCKRGHPFAGVNLVTFRGKRYCRTCMNMNHRAMRARKRAQS